MQNALKACGNCGHYKVMHSSGMLECYSNVPTTYDENQWGPQMERCACKQFEESVEIPLRVRTLDELLHDYKLRLLKFHKAAALQTGPRRQALYLAAHQLAEVFTVNLLELEYEANLQQKEKK